MMNDNGNVLGKVCFNAVPVLGALFIVLFGTVCLFAQTAMVTNNYVGYPLSASANFQCTVSPSEYTSVLNRSFWTNSLPNAYGQSSLDPWVNSALIEFDKVFPNEADTPGYPNHCLTLCAEVTCSNPVRKVESSDSSAGSGGNGNKISTMASGDFPIQSILFDIFKYQANSNPYSPDSTPPIRTIAMYPVQGSGVDNICKGVPVHLRYSTDTTSGVSCCDDCNWNKSCVSNSVLPSQYCPTIYDKTDCQNESPFCSYRSSCNYKAGSCQDIYANGAGDCDLDYCYLTDDHECLPRSTAGSICESSLYKCYNSQYCDPVYLSAQEGWHECNQLENDPCEELTQEECQNTGNIGPQCHYDSTNNVCRVDYDQVQCGGANSCELSFCQPDISLCTSNSLVSCSSFGQESNCNAHSTFCEWKLPSNGVSCNNCDTSVMSKFPSKEACQAGLTTLRFCTAWDGSYEIDGEFGKSNGQFGYRTTIKTNYPGDGISLANDVNIEHMIVYPGDSQIPIQVDVTNVHSVRSSPTLVGKSPAVITSPYRIRYRLSKDATTVINIIDPSDYSVIHRKLVNGQPRDGEGFQGGAQTDIQITNEDAWDGRDDNGRLLPYGNYLVSIQAVSQDEWSGTDAADISRAVTRQLSLDPLKITDIVVQGLGKESTSYAMLSYMLTEGATVHLEVYTPGTTFGDLNIGTETYPYVGTAYTTNTASNGLRVASYVEQKAGRVNVNNKWDGMCWDIENCKATNGYAYGGAMPDGDYVYLLWAEIPYGSSSGVQSYSSTTVVNGIEWDGVKTHMIYNGILPINRGYPEITIDAVSYSTIGSSPIASGLDPFVISYSLSRDSYVDAGIYTTAASGTATAGVCEGSSTCAPYKVKTISENEVKEALTKNTYYWDGLDDKGRYVSAGNYMLRITAKDSLFPSKMVTRTIEFPVDMFRVVDVNTTPLLEVSTGALNGLASISYMLSKSMDVSVRIYDRGIVIPTGGENCSWPPREYNVANRVYCSTHCCIYNSEDKNEYVSPIKEFKGTRQGEGYNITDFWDGYDTETSLTDAIMKEDGLYPYIIIASAPVGSSRYYSSTMTTDGTPLPVNGWEEEGIYASDKVTGYITVSRGPVYFTNIKINPTKPTQYYSSATVELAPYEIQFSVNRSSSVTVEIVSTADNMCMGISGTNTVCRTLTQTNYTSGQLNMNMVYDANVVNTLYWDGKDSNGNYVKTGSYQIRFTGAAYLPNNTVNNEDTGLNRTVESRSLSVNNFQVFDRYIWDVTEQNKEQGKFAYQVSVPMKTAIQIFKPGTRVTDLENGSLYDPITGQETIYSTNVLVKSIIGVRPNLVALESIWDGTDYAGQKVPDGIYPFRYVTVQNSYEMDSVTGDVIVPAGGKVSDIVADWDKYINLGVINVANGDSWYADVDWKSNQVTMFYPNPLREESGFFEITKVPAVGKLSIKIYNIAGDLVRDGGYECVNAVGTTASIEEINNQGGIMPDWNNGTGYDTGLLNSKGVGRNFALRCQWNRKNNAGKKVARGLYYAIMTLDPTRGNAKKTQKVIKILIP